MKKKVYYVICGDCMGEGCSCCNNTGKIQVIVED